MSEAATPESVETPAISEHDETEPRPFDDEANAQQWMQGIGTGAAQGAGTGMVAGPWGALVGGLAGAGLGALQTAQQQQSRPGAGRATPPGRSPAAAPVRTGPSPAQVAATAPLPAAASGMATSGPASTSQVPRTRVVDGGFQTGPVLADLQRLLPVFLQMAAAISGAAAAASPPATGGAPSNPPQGGPSSEDWGGLSYSHAHHRPAMEHHPVAFAAPPSPVVVHAPGSDADLDLESMEAQALMDMFVEHESVWE